MKTIFGIANRRIGSVLNLGFTLNLVLTLILAFTLIGIVGVLAGPADELTRQAILLQKNGQWSEAVSLLRAELISPGAPDLDSDYRGQLKYTLGYVFEQQASVDFENREKLLASSERVYRAVLSDIPNHGPTLHALAMLLARERKTDQALEFLRRAIEHDPRRAGYYLLASGEIHQQEHRWAEALAEFQEAAGLLPGQATPRRRMVDALQKLPFEQLEEMLEVIGTWEESFPDVARKAYETLILGACDNRPRLADRTMMSWVGMMADNEWLFPASLSFLSPGCMVPARDGLLEYLSSPTERPASSNWWMNSTWRKLVLARVAWVLGSRELSASRPETAEKIWANANAYCDLPPNQLVADLAVLYSNHRETLDLRGKKRDRLLHHTFDQKSAAYAKGDLESIERYHTILALIYSTEEKWGNSHNSRTAIFQLEHALRIAGRRDRASGGYRPHAGLKKRLAEGLDATNRKGEARELYLEATMAYLDQDDFKTAAKTLARGSRGSTSGTRKKAEQLNSLMQYRQTLAEGSLASGAVEELYHQNSDWLIGTTPDGGLDQAFLQRQEFKVLSDIAAQSGNSTTSLDCASRAFNLAATGQTTLTGVGDLMRLEKVRDEVAASVGIVGDWEIRNQGAMISAPEGSVKLSLPGTGGSKVVGLSPIVLKAGQIREIVGPESKLILEVGDGALNVVHDFDPQYLDTLVDKIKQVEGVGLVSPK